MLPWDEAYLHGRPPPRPVLSTTHVIPLIHHHHTTTTTSTTTITLQPSLPLPTRYTCSRLCYHWLQSESRSSANQGPTDPRYLPNRFLLTPEHVRKQAKLPVPKQIPIFGDSVPDLILFCSVILPVLHVSIHPPCHRSVTYPFLPPDFCRRTQLTNIFHRHEAYDSVLLLMKTMRMQPQHPHGSPGPNLPRYLCLNRKPARSRRP